MRPSDREHQRRGRLVLVGGRQRGDRVPRPVDRPRRLVGERGRACVPARPPRGASRSLPSIARLVGEGAQPVVEPDRRAELRAPVAGSRRLGSGPLAGLRRDVRHERLGRGSTVATIRSNSLRGSDPSSTSGTRARCGGGARGSSATRARASTSSIAGVGPDSTLKPGAFTAASETSLVEQVGDLVARRHDRQHAAGGERRDEPPALARAAATRRRGP